MLPEIWGEETFPCVFHALTVVTPEGRVYRWGDWFDIDGDY